MKISSDAYSDSRTEKPGPGGYEWWYFAAISGDGKYRLTVKFYEGNPVSTRYNRNLSNGNPQASQPENFPAVSISVYENNEPVFHSFTEYRPDEAHFSGDSPDLVIGSHKMRAERKRAEVERAESAGAESGGAGRKRAENDASHLLYSLNLKEKLPNGDAIVASLEFEGRKSPGDLLSYGEGKETHRHSWNLILPRAGVTGNIRIYSRNEKTNRIDFSGTGYHDHNTGLEPMKNKFREWYRGHYHFEYGTFIYYIMNMKEDQQHCAWIINNRGDRVLHNFRDITLQDKTLSLYGMLSARKIIFHSGNAQVNIQQSKILDNGPFYQYYSSDAFLHVPENEAVEASEGFSEYLRPDRIYWRLFWPLINMRVRYRAQAPHWVQYFKKFYRWTW